MEEQIWYKALLGHVIYIAIILVVIFVVQRVADVVINKYFRTLQKFAEDRGEEVDEKRYKTLATALRKIVSIILWGVAILLVLDRMGVNIAVLLSGAGAVGIFLGIAGKDIVMDFYNGMKVLVNNEYRVGDVIILDSDHSGVVEDISLSDVVLRDIDGNIHIVSHSYTSAIINMTYDYSRVKLEVGVAYDSDLGLVKKVVNEVGAKLSEDEDWKEYVINPIAFDRTLSFDDSAITIRAMGDVKAGMQWSIYSEFTERIKTAFEKNGIEIPFPQRVMHMAPENQSKKD